MLLIPDVAVTRHLEPIGRLAFSLRRHRWMFRRDYFADHRLSFALFRAMVRPGDVVHDVGANIGYYSRFILAELDPAFIVAIEPMPANAALLRRNLRPFRPRRAMVLEMALADREGVEDLQIDNVHHGTAVLDRLTGGAAAAGRRLLGLEPCKQPVVLETLDRLVAAGRIPAPQFVKIDTEGAELMVLDGAREVLRSHRPRLLLAAHGKDEARSTIERLTGLGYLCAGVVRRNRGRVVERLTPESDLTGVDNNLMFAPSLDDIRLDAASSAGFALSRSLP